MTRKAYIVANEQQERDVLEKLEQEGYRWVDHYKPTYFTPRKYHYVVFPYAIITNDFIGWLQIVDAILENYEIVYDGRKEEKMSEKYVVSQEFMNELEEWKDYCFEEYDVVINSGSIEDLPIVVNAWWGDDVPDKENNNRLIAIIRWVNGEDVFEVEKPKKWVVRSKETDIDGDYRFVVLKDSKCLARASQGLTVFIATKFDTKEEAESWANAHQEVIEVKE